MVSTQPVADLVHYLDGLLWDDDKVMIQRRKRQKRKMGSRIRKRNCKEICGIDHELLPVRSSGKQDVSLSLLLSAVVEFPAGSTRPTQYDNLLFFSLPFPLSFPRQYDVA